MSLKIAGVIFCKKTYSRLNLLKEIYYSYYVPQLSLLKSVFKLILFILIYLIVYFIFLYFNRNVQTEKNTVPKGRLWPRCHQRSTLHQIRSRICSAHIAAVQRHLHWQDEALSHITLYQASTLMIPYLKSSRVALALNATYVTKSHLITIQKNCIRVDNVRWGI